MKSQPAQIADMTQHITNAHQDMNAMLTNYINAAAKSHTAAWQGFEALTRDLSGLMQESFARAVSASTTLLAAKTPQQAAETHADFMKDCLEGIVAGHGKLSEISLRAAKQTIDPLAQHATETVDAIMKKAKAA